MMEFEVYNKYGCNSGRSGVWQEKKNYNVYTYEGMFQAWFF